MTIVKNFKGQAVGEIKDGNYITQRDYKRGQIFNKKHDNPIGVDVKILQQLIRANVREIHVTIVNYEERSFVLGITLADFIGHSEKVRFDKRNEYGERYTGYGEQRIVPMRFWKRLSNKDKLLNRWLT